MSNVLRHQAARWTTGILAGGIVAFAVGVSNAFWDTALLAGWDVGLVAYLGLTYWMMTKTDTQRTLVEAQAGKPATFFTLGVVIITSAIGLLAAIALSSRTNGRGDLAQVLHFAVGAIAVFAAWLLVHTEFALYYARVYYDEVLPAATPRTDSTAVSAPFRKGLAFPDADVVDYWDFMYYAFTIAMCYQTSDVTVNQPKMRRITLFHSILSFVYVLVILSFAINAIGAVI